VDSRRNAEPQSAWRRSDLLGLVVAVAVGASLLAAGYGAAAGRRTLDGQVNWVILSVVGLAVAFAAQATWLLRGRRAVVGYRYQLLGEAPLQALSPVRTQLASSRALVAGDRLRWYHRSDCPVVVQSHWSTATRHAHEAAGRLPCGICRP